MDKIKIKVKMKKQAPKKIATPEKKVPMEMQSDAKQKAFMLKGITENEKNIKEFDKSSNRRYLNEMAEKAKAKNKK